MSYKLVFKKEALKEWRKLDEVIKHQFKKKLEQRLINPRVKSAKLSGMKDCYKIKLRQAGYRLVYEIREKTIVLSVVAIGKRERNLIYKIASKRV